MKINTKTRYGIRTMLEISLEKGNEGVFQKDIALKQGISAKYLDQIISALKISGLIKNSKGKKSGYILTRPAREISMLHIVAAFTPGELIIECASGDGGCPVIGKCAAQNMWAGLDSSIKEYLGSWSLEKLREDQLKIIDSEKNSSMYYI